MNFKVVLLLFLTILSLLGAIYIYRKTKGKSNSTWVIFFFLICFTFIFGETLALNVFGPENNASLLVLASYLFYPTILMLGPLFHLYNRSLVKTGEQQFFYKHRVHFLLPVMILTINLFCFVALDILKPESSNYKMLSDTFWYINFVAFFLAFFVQNLYYIYLATDNYRLQKSIVGASENTLSWIRNFIATYALVFAFLYLFQLPLLVPGKLIFRISLVFYIGFIIYFGQFEYENISENVTRRKLTDQKMKELRKKMEQVMLTDKPYLDQDLNIHDLSKKLGTNPKYLSYMINTEFERNFPSYINTLRIEEAKVLMTKPDSQIFTIEAIAKMIGFRSKSSFNSAFKKNNGTTPSEFRKSLIGK